MFSIHPFQTIPQLASIAPSSTESQSQDKNQSLPPSGPDARESSPVNTDTLCLVEAVEASRAAASTTPASSDGAITSSRCTLAFASANHSTQTFKQFNKLAPLNRKLQRDGQLCDLV